LQRPRCGHRWIVGSLAIIGKLCHAKGVFNERRFGYDWYAANLGGDYPVLDCTEVGVVSEPLTVAVEGNRLAIRGRFGVFCRGTAKLVFQDTEGRSCDGATVERKVSPVQPLVLGESLAFPPREACTVTLTIHDASGRNLGSLATAKLPITTRFDHQ
jgi:hypothetical protein